jgi:hypothetical protein
VEVKVCLKEVHELVLNKVNPHVTMNIGSAFIDGRQSMCVPTPLLTVTHYMNIMNLERG